VRIFAAGAITATKLAISSGLADYTGAVLSDIRTATANALRAEINDNLEPANLRGRVPVEGWFS
jgi:hypothetical protein